MKRPCPKSNVECKYAPHCYVDKHHPDWPKSNYTSSLEKTYREVRAIGNYICRTEHDEIHATEEPPVKPNPADMVAFIMKSELYLPELPDAA